MGITAVLTAASLLAAGLSVDREVVGQAMDQLTSDGGVHSVQVRVTDGRRQFAARSGDVPQNGSFRIGSVTKPFVAAVVLQLAGEGEVELDAPVARYLPDLLPYQDITVRQILQHTSGLFSYTRALPLSPDGFEPIRDKHWEAKDLVAIAASRPLVFPPGTKWEYSNTNYIVAGLLVEKLTGKPYADAITQRILKPLRLNDTYLPGDDQDIRGPHAHAYWTANGKASDITHINPSVAGASGEMISTTRDLDTFIVALTSGKLLKPAQQAELTRTTEVSPEYGLGLRIRTVCGTPVWGHGGGIPGFSTELFTTPDNRRRLVLSAATAATRGNPGPALEKLQNEVFCGAGALSLQALTAEGEHRYGPVPHNGQFRAGSLNKTFVSTVLLQLAGEGEVELDAPVDRYLPGLLPHKEITVRQILQQTSGLFNYPELFSKEPEDLQKIRFKHWEPQELVAMATGQPLHFPPGTQWRYANTNYVVAGLLVEKLTGEPYARAVEERILKPLRLKDTYLPGDETGIRRPHAHAYWMRNGRPDDLTRVNPSVAWASGELISTTRDLDAFIVALAKGELLEPAQQQELVKTTSASPQYGLGLVVQTRPCGTVVWGHFGDIRGYETQVWTTPDTKKRAVVSTASAPSGGDVAPVVDEIIDRAVC